MRKVILKGVVITGEGENPPYTVVADIAEIGVICKDKNGASVILQHEDVSASTSYSMKPAETATQTVPTTPNKTNTKEKEVKQNGTIFGNARNSG